MKKWDRTGPNPSLIYAEAESGSANNLYSGGVHLKWFFLPFVGIWTPAIWMLAEVTIHLLKSSALENI